MDLLSLTIQLAGTVAGFEGYYNFYNIGATSSTAPLGAIKNGLQFAKDGKGASEETKANLLIPWDSPQKAIKGGAVFIGSSYILVGQNNLYLQKFDVNDDRGTNLFWHQYMTNCLAPYSESSGIYKAYNSNGMLNSSIRFIIPIFENMPKYMTETPNINEADYIADNTKMYADVTGSLNVRTGPSTSYEVLTGIDRNRTLTRIKKGVQNGERWDKVELDNGMIGYVFQTYLKEVPKPTITNIKLSIDNPTIQKGSTEVIKIAITPQEAQEEIIWETSDENIVSVDQGKIIGLTSGKATITARTVDGRIHDSIEITVYSKVTNIILDKQSVVLLKGNKMTLSANILPEDASNQKVVWNSEDETIASVVDGVITANKEGTTNIIVKAQNEDIKAICKVEVKELPQDIILEFDQDLRIEADEISNLDIEKLTVSKIKEKINTNLLMEFYDFQNKPLAEEDKIGTGSKLQLKNELGEVIYEYTFIIYGDVNGDGEINSLDVLIIQKHILEIKEINGIFLKSANTSKNGQLPSSLDVLKIQKHILEIKYIGQ